MPPHPKEINGGSCYHQIFLSLLLLGFSLNLVLNYSVSWTNNFCYLSSTCIHKGAGTIMDKFQKPIKVIAVMITTTPRDGYRMYLLGASECKYFILGGLGECINMLKIFLQGPCNQVKKNSPLGLGPSFNPSLNATKNSMMVILEISHMTL